MAKRKKKSKGFGGIGITLVALLCVVGILGFAYSKKDDVVNSFLGSFVDQTTYKVTYNGQTLSADEYSYIDVPMDKAVRFDLSGAFSSGYSVKVDYYIGRDEKSPAYKFKSGNKTYSISDWDSASAYFEGCFEKHDDYFTFKIPRGTTVKTVLEENKGLEDVEISYKGMTTDEFVSAGFYNFAIIIEAGETRYVIPFRISTYSALNVTIDKSEVVFV